MSSAKEQPFVLGLWGVRYQVKDVQRSISFYTETLGFNLDRKMLPAFGQVSTGNLKLILSGPGASGYPPPFDAPCAARTRRRLGDAGRLRDFGVNLMTVPPIG